MYAVSRLVLGKFRPRVEETRLRIFLGKLWLARPAKNLWLARVPSICQFQFEAGRAPNIVADDIRDHSWSSPPTLHPAQASTQPTMASGYGLNGGEGAPIPRFPHRAHPIRATAPPR